MILVDYIKDEKYKKVAHFINEKNENVYAIIYEVHGKIIYEELPQEEQLRIQKNIFLNYEEIIYKEE